MIEKRLHFALWAEDIGQYLHTGYNVKSLNEVEAALRNYISVDETEGIDYAHLSLLEIIQMTGLSLDYSKSNFNFMDECSDKTLNYRKGVKVPCSFLN